MCILNYSRDILDTLKIQTLSEVDSINSFDFSTLYTTIPHAKLKSKLKENILNYCYSHKNEDRRMITLFLGLWTYISLRTTLMPMQNILKMSLNCWNFLSTIFTWSLADRFSSKKVGISIGTNCTPYLPTYFFTGMSWLLKACEKRLIQKFNFIDRYMDDALSVTNSKISEFINLIYPCEFEIKATT